VASSPNWIRAGLSPLTARSANVTNVASRKTGTKIAIERATVIRVRLTARRTLIIVIARRLDANDGA
jgi:hypothetical protein